jgi:hypothetical protein
MTRRRLLTDAQARELRALYALWSANRPKKLCARFGISRHALVGYVKGEHKRAPYTAEELARELGYE